MFRFIKERDPNNRFDNLDIEMKTDASSLPEILEIFESFLRASGFCFNGELVIEEVEDFDESPAE